MRTGDAAKAVKAAPHAARTMWAHAYQAFLFNQGAAAACGAGDVPAALPLIGSAVDAPDESTPARRSIRSGRRATATVC